MWSERLQQNQKFTKDFRRLNFPRDGFVHKDHQRRDRSVKAKPVQIFRYFFDAGVERFKLCGCGVRFLHAGSNSNLLQELRPALWFGGEVLLEVGFALFIDEEPPRAAEK